MNSPRDDAPLHLSSRRSAFVTAALVGGAIALLVIGAIVIVRALAAQPPTTERFSAPPFTMQFAGVAR